MSRGAKILPEQDHGEALNTYGWYFKDQIGHHGWDKLVYNTSDFYCEEIVRKFYTKIQLEDISIERQHIEIKWDDDENAGYYVINPELISDVLGIPLATAASQNPMPMGEYVPIMGRNCRIYSGGGGIQATSVYRNVYATGRWLKSNVVGDSHVSSFYREELHMIHMLMTRNPHFCICRQLFHSIAKAANRTARRQVTSFVLPCLITKIAATWIDPDVYAGLIANDHVGLKKTKITGSYSSAVQMDWTPTVHPEDVPAASASTSSSTGSSVFRQYRELPEDQRERENVIYKSNRALFKTLKKFICGGGFEKKDEGTSAPRSDPLHEEPIRVQPLRRCSTARRRGPGIVIEEVDPEQQEEGGDPMDSE